MRFVGTTGTEAFVAAKAAAVRRIMVFIKVRHKKDGGLMRSCKSANELLVAVATLT